ncbi:hypothetical protein [Kitasatospora sp. NBC_01302]|nr:hypothetical protein OG294_40660 [Kitasatospora sp. NBC_01302]
MDTAIRWTGQKARLLQETLELSIREFARKLEWIPAPSPNGGSKGTA